MDDIDSGNIKRKVLILPKPKDDSEHQYTLVVMVHPRTRSPTRFLKTDDNSGLIYELTAITGQRRAHLPGEPRSADIASEKARSLLIENVIDMDSDDTNDTPMTDNDSDEEPSYYLSDPTITVCTPVSPLFFVLEALFKSRAQFMQPDVIYEMLESQTREASSSATPIDYETFKKAAFPICIPMIKDQPPEVPNQLSENNLYKLSMVLLVKHFDQIVQRVLKAGLPQEIKTRMVEGPLLPPYTSENQDSQLDPELVQIASERAAIHLICSYVPPELSSIYIATKRAKFDKVDAEIEKVTKQKQEAAAAQAIISTAGLSTSHTPAENYKKRPASDSASVGSNKKQAIASTAVQSRAAKTLAKVDKSNIRSLSSFFKPAPKKK